MPVTQIRAVIAGRDIRPSEILAWEAKRLSKAARRIGLPVPAGDPTQQRVVFADAKLALGAEEIRRRLHRQLRVSDSVSRMTASLSGTARGVSVCDLYVSGGDATAFAEWFNATDRPDYERSMLAANPDHFLISTTPTGQQEVIETTGGSPLPSRFLIDYQDLATLRTPIDPSYEANASGVARTLTGAVIGGVRHQFRNTDTGFHAHLTVEFPKLLSPHMIREHRWHLATEFTNWIEFAFNPSRTH